MKLPQDQYQQFLQNHRVFNTDELELCCAVSGYHARNLLAKLTREQKVRRLRNRLYSVLPVNAQNDFTPPALLVAAKLTPDAVLGYRSALAFYGMSRNLQSSHTFLSRHRIKPCRTDNAVFQPCLPAKQLKNKDDFGVEMHSAWNTPVRVVGKERLLVDLLDRLDLSGGWEEVVNAYQYEDALDWKKLVGYLKLLKHPATAARVGFFLEQFQHSMKVPDGILEELEALKPQSAEHFYRGRRTGKLQKRWNLYVPEELLQSEEKNNYEF